MNHDHEIYGADAHEFNPSRYLDNEGRLKPALINTKEESHGKFFFFFFSFAGSNEFTNYDFSFIWIRSSNLSRQVGVSTLYATTIFIFFFLQGI
jgi:hypothetical protein